LFVTVNKVPNGRVGWAAVKREELKISPEAVGRPSNSGPYQEAMPSCRKMSGVWAAVKDGAQMAAAKKIRAIRILLIFPVSAFEGAE
jgi:maltose-binding protein MalE